MLDIIHLLPENVANQIAAGEVIQRPASAVKELLENAVDSGANRIDLILKDAGKGLIMVTDNGCGMSKGDLERCILRHATSKIHQAADLFAIRTLGFRGEALASIASIAHLEIKSRRHNDETGFVLEVEGSEIKNLRETAGQEGTSVSVKNLFYNVPARRKFLKSNSAELRHILEEFYRVALVRPEVAFSVHHNERLLHKLIASNMLQRITSLFGDVLRERLLPVKLDTEFLKIQGYIGKPENVRKTKGEQYFFANQRFIRHPYLHHAVMNAYQDLIPDSTHPTYFLFMEVDPGSIDVNIHPTKTEIKFQDEKMIYGMMRSAVREALGKSAAMPSLDFDAERSFELPPEMRHQAVKVPQIKIDPDYNPFRSADRQLSDRERHNRERWTELFSSGAPQEMFPPDSPLLPEQPNNEQAAPKSNYPEQGKVFQLFNTYIAAPMKSGLLLVHQARAHQKILYERFLTSIRDAQYGSQQQLFPLTLHFTPNEAALLLDLMEDPGLPGFDIRDMGGGSFVVDGAPADLRNNNIQYLLESLLESYKEGLEQKRDKDVSAARAMARSLAIKRGDKLQPEEMHAIIDDLFACPLPEQGLDGKACLRILKEDELNQSFD